MIRTVVLVATLLVAQEAAATQITFHNNCNFNLDLQHSQSGSGWRSIANFPKGKSHTFDANGPAHAFRHGGSDQSTLAEFSIPAGQPWYDISIIPPAPGNCNSYENCRQVTGRSGFNVGMRIEPKSNLNGANCRALNCPVYDKGACGDAYLFPDDKKTHDCPGGTNFNVVFCP
ncbi:hypothetical protein Poli38472_014770 [Pythium oligandrum]|uniref:Thaumatin-like protein n=1 Tax=Pythium oligandrum TaxID=41045 RepID=A0A8K1C212_PYTOL|nr:hypothetical protein Poli38472_014770 [Pythium oligandrum]|eukprot:TMW54999.1 hypothetical protein Poli38472_014770 [Pythium oligandrum]